MVTQCSHATMEPVTCELVHLSPNNETLLLYISLRCQKDEAEALDLPSSNSTEPHASISTSVVYVTTRRWLKAESEACNGFKQETGFSVRWPLADERSSFHTRVNAPMVLHRSLHRLGQVSRVVALCHSFPSDLTLPSRCCSLVSKRERDAGDVGTATKAQWTLDGLVTVGGWIRCCRPGPSQSHWL